MESGGSTGAAQTQDKVSTRSESYTQSAYDDEYSLYSISGLELGR